MTKEEAIKTYLQEHKILIEADCLDEEADDVFIEACKKIRDWVLSIEEKQSGKDSEM